jgi:hypothetical protein
MIFAHHDDQRAMRQALDEAMDELDAALDDSSDNRLTEAMRRVFSLERELGYWMEERYERTYT